jgi:hypothetical protein
MEAGTIKAEPLVSIYAAPDALAAQMIRGLLEAEGIFAVIGEQVTDAYAPALQVASGVWGEICVRAEDQERAQAVLDAALEGEYRIAEEELEAAATTAFDPDV